jgi:hypothetical protein
VNPIYFTPHDLLAGFSILGGFIFGAFTANFLIIGGHVIIKMWEGNPGEE